MKRFIPLICLFPLTSLASQLTNSIQGIGPEGKVRPHVCIQDKQGQVTLDLTPGKSGDVFKASGQNYYSGASLRFDGCSTNNSYLGYIDFIKSSQGATQISNYTPPQGVPIALSEGRINSSGNLEGKVEYTTIDYNPDLSHAKNTKYWQFAGVNLSGLEFSKMVDPVVIPNLSKQNKYTNTSDLATTETFIQAGMNTIRVPVRWGYLQLDGPGKGNIDMAYFDSYVKPLLQTLTHAKVHTIVDLHAYMRYAKFGEQYAGCGTGASCPDGTLILDEKAYQSVWTQLHDAIKNDPKIDTNYLLFDLVNEPVEVPNDKVFTIQASLIKMLRKNGFNGYILVEGNAWSGLHSWSSHEWQGDDGMSYNNATLFTRENFTQAGIDDLSKILINVHQYLDSDYSGTHDDCLQDLTTSGDNGFNLQDFVDYLQRNKLKAIVTEFGTGKNAPSCTKPLKEFMAYLQNNSSNGKEYGFAGWTIWSSGHGWGDYNLRVTPDSYHMVVLKQFL